MACLDAGTTRARSDPDPRRLTGAISVADAISRLRESGQQVAAQLQETLQSLAAGIGGRALQHTAAILR